MTIKVKDLVRVKNFSACCHHPLPRAGSFFVVQFKFTTGRAICKFCKREVENISCSEGPEYSYADMNLEKIPPWSELENKETQEKNFQKAELPVKIREPIIVRK